MIIPLSFAAAWMTRRRHPAGPLVAGSLLVMLVIVSASMLLIAPFAFAAGLGSDPAVRAQLVAFSVVFSVFGARGMAAGHGEAPHGTRRCLAHERVVDHPGGLMGPRSGS